MDVTNTDYTPIALSVILPGSGQFHEGERKKGLLYLTATAGSGLLAYNYHSKYQQNLQSYQQHRDRYKTATDPEEITLQRSWAESSLGAARENEMYRNVMLGLFSGIWTVNILDIIF